MTCTTKARKKSTMRAYSTADQTVAVDGNISYDNFIGTGEAIEPYGATGVQIKHSGLYLISFSASGSSETAGDITVQLERNGVPVAGALATFTNATIATVGNMAFTAVVEVLGSCVCADNTAVFTVANVGVGATFANAQLNAVRL